MNNLPNIAIQIYNDKQKDLNLVYSKSSAQPYHVLDRADTTPLIFTKKVNTAYKTIPQKSVIDILGHSRHFPAASKEWFNSVYAYNNNYIKNLPVWDKNLQRFMESYFNNVLREAPFTRKTQPNRSFPLRLSSIEKRLERLSLNKIFLSKAELKHSSDKVIITLFVFNQEKITLNRTLKAYLTNIFPSSKLLKSVLLPLQNKPAELEAAQPAGEKKVPQPSQPSQALLASQASQGGVDMDNVIKPLSLKKNLLLFHSEIHLQAQQKNINSNFPWLTKGTIPRRSLVEVKPFSINSYHSMDTNSSKTWPSFFWKNLNLEWKALMETIKNLSFNHLKFDQSYLLKIKPLISKLYNKKVEFNIINLKQIHLHTDIFTQVIANKLKDRDNSLLDVLASALSVVKLPEINRMDLRYGIDYSAYLWSNKVKNLAVYSDILSLPGLPSSLPSPSSSPLPSVFKAELMKKTETVLSSVNLCESEDLLNKLLKGSVQTLELGKDYHNNNLISSALHRVKHKSIVGVRLEAKGRLTRRFTAARSVFKVKWKGGLTNIDASYKGLSSVVLRGHAKSNVQYSQINSKNRNGAYSVKGSISGK